MEWKVAEFVDDLDPISKITLVARRPGEGIDAHIPMILRDGELYDEHLDRFFYNLPLSGIRSRHSLRAYGYDILVWVRFLYEAVGKTVWEAERDDVLAYHRARRSKDPEYRISATTWNRTVASLDRLYRWAVQERLVAQMPFTHRTVFRLGYGGRPHGAVGRNDSYERANRQPGVSFVTIEEFRRFRDIGLRGMLPDGTPRPGSRDRNGIRNALFAEILLTTGLRLEEATFLFASDLISADCQAGRNVWIDLPDALTKGDRGRQILVPKKLMQQARAYIDVERAHAITKFQYRQGWQRIERPICILPDRTAKHAHMVSGGNILLDQLTPDERARVLICEPDGTPKEPAVLWLTEVGLPVLPNSWEVIFARACERCRAFDFPICITPHQLRHTFAVHMLAMLIQQRLREAALPDTTMEGYRQILGDPLQQVQRLLGHANLTTTYVYLDHIAGRADTVDAAVEELLALLPPEAVL
jgi:site-specific recombinase XerD